MLLVVKSKGYLASYINNLFLQIYIISVRDALVAFISFMWGQNHTIRMIGIIRKTVSIYNYLCSLYESF